MRSRRTGEDSNALLPRFAIAGNPIIVSALVIVIYLPILYLGMAMKRGMK